MAAKKRKSSKRKGSTKLGRASKACKGMGKMKRKACMRAHMKKH